VFDGWAAARNVAPTELPLDRLCNLVYFWLVRNADEKRKAEIDAALDRPTSGDDPDVGSWSADAELSAFTAAASTAASATR
jgi:hypothetical protein